MVENKFVKNSGEFILWFYIILFCICIFFLVFNNFIKPNQKKIFEIIILIILCLISGTRYYLGGTDYYIYKTVFDGLPTIKDFVMYFPNIHNYYPTYGFESGYLFINSLIKTIGFNFFGFTLLHSIFFYSCLYVGLKKYAVNFNLLIIVFLYKIFFYNTFISMRQSITIAIFFLAIKYIEEKKILKYFSMSLIAILFHNAALIMFPIYFIHKFNLTKKKLIIANFIFVPTILISVFNVPVMQIFDFLLPLFENPVATEKAENLLTTDPNTSLGIFHTLEYFLIMFFVIIFFDKLIKVDKHSALIIKLFVVLLPIFTLFSGYEIVTRIKDYFVLTYAIIIGYLCLIDNKKYRNIVQIATILICGFGFFRFILLFDNGAMIPYESYLFKGISIFNDK